MNLNEDSSSQEQASDHISSSTDAQQSTISAHKSVTQSIGITSPIFGLDAGLGDDIYSIHSTRSGLIAGAFNVPAPNLVAPTIQFDENVTDAITEVTTTQETTGNKIQMPEIPYISMESVQNPPFNISSQVIPPIAFPVYKSQYSTATTTQSLNQRYSAVSVRDTPPIDKSTPVIPAGIPLLPQQVPTVPQIAEGFYDVMRVRPYHDSSGLAGREAQEAFYTLPCDITVSAFSPQYIEDRALEMGVKIDRLTANYASLVVYSQLEMLLDQLNGDNDITSAKLNLALQTLKIAVSDEFSIYCQSLRLEQ